jgi:hypothetical protein
LRESEDPTAVAAPGAIHKCVRYAALLTDPHRLRSDHPTSKPRSPEPLLDGMLSCKDTVKFVRFKARTCFRH